MQGVYISKSVQMIHPTRYDDNHRILLTGIARLLDAKPYSSNCQTVIVKPFFYGTKGKNNNFYFSKYAFLYY